MIHITIESSGRGIAAYAKRSDAGLLSKQLITPIAVHMECRAHSNQSNSEWKEKKGKITPQLIYIVGLHQGGLTDGDSAQIPTISPLNLARRDARSTECD